MQPGTPTQHDAYLGEFDMGDDLLAEVDLDLHANLADVADAPLAEVDHDRHANLADVAEWTMSGGGTFQNETHTAPHSPAMEHLFQASMTGYHKDVSATMGAAGNAVCQVSYNDGQGLYKLAPLNGGEIGKYITWRGSDVQVHQCAIA